MSPEEKAEVIDGLAKELQVGGVQEATATCVAVCSIRSNLFDILSEHCSSLFVLHDDLTESVPLWLEQSMV